MAKSKKPDPTRCDLKQAGTAALEKMKGEQPKEEPQKIEVPRIRCGTCIFYAGQRTEDEGDRGYCHRFPSKLFCNPMHWCGEYSPSVGIRPLL